MAGPETARNIRVTAFDSTHGVESVVMSFIVNRPRNEPGFRLVRTEEPGRTVRYSIESYAVGCVEMAPVAAGAEPVVLLIRICSAMSRIDWSPASCFLTQLVQYTA